jgi:hypothetical protein
MLSVGGAAGSAGSVPVGGNTLNYAINFFAESAGPKKTPI